MKGIQVWLLITLILLIILGYIFTFLNKTEDDMNVQPNNFTLFNFTIEPTLIDLDVSQLVLDSHDVEAGYSLKRKFSGFRENESYDYFIKRFDKEVLTSNKEIRTVYSEAYKFKTIEETDQAFRHLLNRLVSIEYNPTYEILDFEQIGDSSFLYKTNYFYDFYPFESYVALIKYRNVIFKITLFGYFDAVDENELTYYARKLIELSKEEQKENIEIPKNQIALPEENLMVELVINNQSSSKIPKWRDKYLLNNYYDELKVGYNSEKELYTYLFYDSDKQFLKINTCINHSYEAISLLPQFFYLRDNEGNHYTAFTKDGNSADSLDKGRKYCLNYVFPIFKELKHQEINFFEIVFNTDEGVILGKSGFYLDDMGEN